MSDINDISDCEVISTHSVVGGIDSLLRGSTQEEKLQFLRDTQIMYHESCKGYERGNRVFFLLFVFFAMLFNCYLFFVADIFYGLQLNLKNATGIILATGITSATNLIAGLVSLWFSDGFFDYLSYASHLKFLQEKYGRDNLVGEHVTEQIIAEKMQKLKEYEAGSLPLSVAQISFKELKQERDGFYVWGAILGCFCFCFFLHESALLSLVCFVFSIGCLLGGCLPITIELRALESKYGKERLQ